MDSGGLGCAVWFCALSVVVVGGMPNARTSQSPRELDGFGSLRMAWHQPKPLFWCGKRTQNVCVLLYRPAASVVGWVFLSSVFFPWTLECIFSDPASSLIDRPRAWPLSADVPKQKEL